MSDVAHRLKSAQNWERDHNDGAGWPYDGFHAVAPEWVQHYRDDVPILQDDLEHARILALKDLEVRTALHADNERLKEERDRALDLYQSSVSLAEKKLLVENAKLLKMAEAAKGEAARHNDAAALRGQDHCYCDMCDALAAWKGEG